MSIAFGDTGSVEAWVLAARLCALALLIVRAAGLQLFGKEEIIPDDPADKLYNEGLYLLNNKHDYKLAAKRFEEVDRQHPYSEWARKALLMSAYAHYEANQYDDSVTAAKRYVTLHPGSPDAAYAQFLIGSSYFDQIPDITARPAAHREGDAALDEVSRKYPNTEYAAAAKKKLEIARDQLAGKEMDTARYYQKRRDTSRRSTASRW
jgi:outer membrane protein assembly factor BamD